LTKKNASETVALKKKPEKILELAKKKLGSAGTTDQETPSLPEAFAPEVTIQTDRSDPNIAGVVEKKSWFRPRV
jgi:hypothetical protein